MPLAPSLSEALEVIFDTRLNEINTSFPAEVVSYDKNKQTATLRPMVRRTVFSTDINDNPDEYEALPNLPNVPIQHPRAGSTFIHIPVRAGDFVWVVVCQTDISTWRSTGRISDPAISVNHDLTSVWAIPGAFPEGSELASADVSDTDITIVNDAMKVTVKTDSVEFGGSSDAAALASKVSNLQSNLNSFIASYNVHKHGGVALGTGITKVSDTPGAASSETFASTRIKTDS